jgi:hypothetical protein
MIALSNPLIPRLREASRLLGWRLPFTGVSWLARPCYLVFARDLGAELPLVPRQQITHWTILTERDIPAIGAVDPMMTASEVSRRLAEGQVCRLAWIGSDVVYFHWDTDQPAFLPYLRLTFRPRLGQACVDASFMARGYRGRSIYAEAAITGLYQKRDRGARTMLAFVAWWHQPTIRLEQRDLGASIVGSIGYWNCGFRRVYFTTGAVTLDSPTSFRVDV